MVLMDRSWYNRAGVERVMGFCSEDEYAEFMYSCPIFEEMLTRSDIHIIKYWFSVSDDVQEKRFQGRIADSTKRWKLSPMDIESRNRWVRSQRVSRSRSHSHSHSHVGAGRRTFGGQSVPVLRCALSGFLPAHSR